MTVEHLPPSVKLLSKTVIVTQYEHRKHNNKNTEPQDNFKGECEL
jgi:hypothetical protein